MKRLSVTLSALALAALLLAPVSAFAQETPEAVETPGATMAETPAAEMAETPGSTSAGDPVAVVQQFVDSANANDDAAVLDLFADDATVTLSLGELGSETWTGKDEIGGEFTGGGEESNMRAESVDLKGDGDKVTGTINLYGDELAQAGVEPAELALEATVTDGKIQTMTLTGTPEWVQKVNDAMAAAGETPGAAMAETPGALVAETPSAMGPGMAETPGAMAADGAASGPGKLPASGSDTTNWLLVTLVGMLGVGGLGAGAWMRRRAA